jgi:2,5-diketo-D-gluconate reductase B
MDTIEIRGTRVPLLGFGTGQVTGDVAVDDVRDALAIGYRHIDTGRNYGTEPAVGRAIADSGIPREEIFVTTKVPREDARAADVERAAEESLTALRIDAIDLLLLHWPNPEVPLAETMGALNKVLEDGRAKRIGVGSFPPGMLEQALALAPIFCNQVEYHPFLGQPRLLELAEEHDLLITAFSPLGRGRAFGDPTLQRIGARHGKSPGQVALRWLLDQPRVSVIPKASTHERRTENFEVFDFALSDADRERIAALPKDGRTADPAWAPDWDA